jgi:hypothetical protein
MTILVFQITKAAGEALNRPMWLELHEENANASL